VYRSLQAMGRSDEIAKQSGESEGGFGGVAVLDGGPKLSSLNLGIMRHSSE
jgi:hypothetical protein